MGQLDRGTKLPISIPSINGEVAVELKTQV
jgi:hypothetical protein